MQVIKLINLIKYFQLTNGLKIFISLLFSKNGFYVINNSAFANKIFLRKDQSDPAIFEQVFCEQQYMFDYMDPQNVKFIIDAGGNIGLAAIYFASKYPNAKILSIEPDSGNFELLKKNTSSYPNVICKQSALWHKNEELHISNSEEFSASYMVESGADENHIQQTVPGITIDEIIKEYNLETISILKIDIEGSEKEIFEFNYNEWLPKTKVIITELHDWVKPGTSKVFFKTMSAFDWKTYIKGENIICIRT